MKTTRAFWLSLACLSACSTGEVSDDSILGPNLSAERERMREELGEEEFERQFAEAEWEQSARIDEAIVHPGEPTPRISTAPALAEGAVRCWKQVKVYGDANHVASDKHAAGGIHAASLGWSSVILPCTNDSLLGGLWDGSGNLGKCDGSQTHGGEVLFFWDAKIAPSPAVTQGNADRVQILNTGWLAPAIKGSGHHGHTLNLGTFYCAYSSEAGSYEGGDCSPTFSPNIQKHNKFSLGGDDSVGFAAGYGTRHDSKTVSGFSVGVIAPQTGLIGSFTMSKVPGSSQFSASLGFQAQMGIADGAPAIGSFDKIHQSADYPAGYNGEVLFQNDPSILVTPVCAANPNPPGFGPIPIAADLPALP